MSGELTSDLPVGTLLNLQDSNQGQVRVLVSAPASAGLVSFAGRTTPAAVPTAGDYTSAQVSDASSAGGPTVFDSLNHLSSQICAKSGTSNPGSFACAENVNTIASGAASHAEGNTSHATGDNSHAEGRGGTALGDGGHVEGVGCSSAGTGAHAEGFGTITSGTAAHAEGFQTSANADTTHAEGQGSIATGTSSHAEGYFTVSTGNASHAGGAGSNAWLNCDYAHSGAGFSVPGDAQYRSGEPRGSTLGSLPGESNVLVQGVLGEPLNLQNSTCYGVTVRATSTRMALGASPRECAFFHFEFLMAVDSAGGVTLSAVTQVTGPTTMGAGFVGATLVPSGVNRVGATPARLALTFTIAGGLTVQSHIVAHIEYVEILGT